MKLYTLNGSIIWHVSYISIKLLNFFLKSRNQWNWWPKGICCCSTTMLCPTLCDLMDCSMPGFLVLHYLLEFAQIHVHWVDDAIQPSHPLSPSSPPALHLSQHHHLFQWVGCSHQVVKVFRASASAIVLPINIQCWLPLGWTVGSPCSPRDSQESSPTLQFKSISFSALSFLYSPTLTSIRDYWKNHSFD